MGIDLGGIFGTVAGATAVGLFPGAAAALGGFELINVLGKASNLEDNAISLVQRTKLLEDHFDSVLTQVSDILTTVQSFARDCDNTVHEIAVLVEQLPSALSKAVDETATKEAFGHLRGDCGNMAATLASKDSIAANLDKLERLSEKISDGISTVDALSLNAFQSLTLTVPALVTWVQGYTAYNLFIPGKSRSASPWEHPIVTGTALPRINSLLKQIQDEQSRQDNLSSILPLEPGVLYTFNGTRFDKSDKPFAPMYQPGQPDDGFYYVIWPDGTKPLDFNGQPGREGVPGVPVSGILCYLSASPPGAHPDPRCWIEAPNKSVVVRLFPAGEAAKQAGDAYPILLADALKRVTAFNQITQGWQQFQTAVNTHLLASDQLKASWHDIPMLSA